MEAWIGAAQSPLGLTAFALFLVFSALSRYYKRSYRVPFLLLACFTLVSGIALSAYRTFTEGHARASTPNAGAVTSGDCSAIVDAKGDVSIRADCAPVLSSVPASTAGATSTTTTTGTGSPVINSGGSVTLDVTTR